MNARNVARIVLVIAVGFAFIAAWALGLFEMLTDPAAAAELLRAMGVWGDVIYVLSVALLEPFFVPGVFFVLPAAMVWPRWLAFGLSLLGAIGAGTVGFAFARFVARDWVAARLPERVRSWDAALAERPIRTVIVIRVLFMLAPPAHWALGLSGVRFAPFFLGTVIGYLPGIAALTFLGGGLLDWLTEQPAQAWLWIVLAVVAITVLIRLSRRRRSRRAPDASNAEPSEEPTSH